MHQPNSSLLIKMQNDTIQLGTDKYALHLRITRMIMTIYFICFQLCPIVIVVLQILRNICLKIKNGGVGLWKQGRPCDRYSITYRNIVKWFC